MENLPSRQQQVLRATVHHYVDTMEPVGSNTLVQRFGLKASAATIRSAMGALESKGLLKQPHASSGRVPSRQGYRHYVDCLLPPPGSAVHYLERELTNLSLQWASLDDLLKILSRRLTDFTGLMSLITRPERNTRFLQEVRLVKSGNRLLAMLIESSNQVSNLNLRLPKEALNQIKAVELWICSQLAHSGDGTLDWSTLPAHLNSAGLILKDAIESHNELKKSFHPGSIFHGMSSLLAQPEFNNGKSFQPLLELIDSHPEDMINLRKDCEGGVLIGDEHPLAALEECSVVQASYGNSVEGIGYVALIGPMRMAYSTALAAVSIVAHHLSRILT